MQPSVREASPGKLKGIAAVPILRKQQNKPLNKFRHFILKGGGWYADGYSKPKEES